MRILEKAEGAFGACVLYEHNGKTFRESGSSVLEIEQRLCQKLNGEPVQIPDAETAEEPETEPETVEESAETETEATSCETQQIKDTPAKKKT